MLINSQVAKNLAKQNLEKFQLPKGNFNSPKEALMNFTWSIDQSFLDETSLAKANLVLDPGACLGRIALAGAFIEKYFPKAKIAYGEVTSDLLRSWMLEDASKVEITQEYIRELLMYENPHAVIVINGEQFDPLSVAFANDNVEVIHPEIEVYDDFWAGIASSMVVAQAFFEQNLDKKIRRLCLAEEILPGTTLVAENLIGAQVNLGKFDEAIEGLKKLVTRRPTFNTLLSLYLLTQDRHWYKKLEGVYSQKVIEVILEEEMLCK